MLSRNVGVMVAGGLGVAFLGYCIYFDRKRRSDPDFKKKLIESKIMGYKLSVTWRINILRSYYFRPSKF